MTELFCSMKSPISVDKNISIECTSSITLSIHFAGPQVYLKFKSTANFDLPIEKIEKQEKPWDHSWNFEPEDGIIQIKLKEMIGKYICENYYCLFRDSMNGLYSINANRYGKSSLAVTTVHVSKMETNEPWIFAIKCNQKEWKTPRLPLRSIQGVSPGGQCMEIITQCPEIVDCILTYYQARWNCSNKDYIQICGKYFRFNGTPIEPNVLFSEKFNLLDQSTRDKIMNYLLTKK